MRHFTQRAPVADHGNRRISGAFEDRRLGTVIAQ
jgi:hypothetical protein